MMMDLVDRLVVKIRELERRVKALELRADENRVPVLEEDGTEGSLDVSFPTRERRTAARFSDIHRAVNKVIPQPKTEWREYEPGDVK